MTPERHEQLKVNMKRLITRKVNALERAHVDLSVKLRMLDEIKALRERLRLHILNYWELTK